MLLGDLQVSLQADFAAYLQNVVRQADAATSCAEGTLGIVVFFSDPDLVFGAALARICKK